MEVDQIFDSNHNGVYLIAELSANHGKQIEIAKKSILAAKEAGVDAVKIQTYTPDTITLNSRKPDFMINQGTIWDGNNLYDLYKEAYLPWEWHEELFQYASEIGITLFSSPFDHTAVDLLEKLNTPLYKIASYEITDIPLIRKAASTGKPIIISTGIATDEDIDLAVKTCREVGNQNIALLKCTSSYPAKAEDANLSMIPDLAKRFYVVSGLSDHTTNNLTSLVSVGLGSRIIEKHFILDRSIGGPDASFSMDIEQTKNWVQEVRQASASLGQVDYSLSEKAKRSREHSRSLYVSKDVKQGDLITTDNVRSVRPGYGLHPKYLDTILGKSFKMDVDLGSRFDLNMVE